MGTMYYGDARYPLYFDDRTLAHLKLVILTKIRRGESFALSWEKSVATGSGHGTVWIHPALTLHFEFLGSKQPEINRAWLEELAESSNRSSGMMVAPEPHGARDDQPAIELARTHE